MDQISEFVDERQKSWCVHCGASISLVDTNLDHVPSKTFLKRPYPENLPVIRICTECNNGFSRDEEYMFVFLQCVLKGSTDPERHGNTRAGRALERNPKLRTKIDFAKTEYKTLGGSPRSVWKPESDRINRIILKNARGHAFYEFGEPMLAKPDQVWAKPLEYMSPSKRAEFENIESAEAWPEVGSRMMTRVLTGQDLNDGWVMVQNGVYRYAVAQQGTIIVRSVLYEYLATEVYWE